LLSVVFPRCCMKAAAATAAAAAAAAAQIVCKTSVISV
jgi:hypothetical protein